MISMGKRIVKYPAAKLRGILARLDTSNANLIYTAQPHRRAHHRIRHTPLL